MGTAAWLCALGGLFQVLGIIAVLIGLLEARSALRRYARSTGGVDIDMGDVDEDSLEPPPWRTLVPVAESVRPKSRVDRELHGLGRGLVNVNRRLTNVAVALAWWADDRTEAVADLVRDISRGWYIVLSAVLLIAGVVLQTLAFFVQR